MKILFLDQSGNLGGAELCLLDIAKQYRDRSLVVLLSDGPFRTALEQQHIPVKVLAHQQIPIQKQSGLLQGCRSLTTLIPVIRQIAALGHEFDAIYANTQKALVIGAIASLLCRRPLVYHLHDILSSEHFSRTNLRVATTLANRVASLIIANSHAAKAAFISAGGCADKATVIYNGFHLEPYLQATVDRSQIRAQLGITEGFVVGHFSRLSPWKGQHVLLEALNYCPEQVIAVFVGDALFGEDDYVEELHRQVEQYGLHQRVRFLGFRSDIPQLMAMCDLVAHTSTAPEPFGRVIVEAMLCGTPVIAAAAGGALELIEPEKNGWLAPPGDATQLANQINYCYRHFRQVSAIAQQAKLQAIQRFHIQTIQKQIDETLSHLPV
ncbi:MAG: glycosyltransferase family 4 protein [Leptolyngbyaceae cyanobacterium bins.302]|nr:glycosyltransferase family 4 protein [Leptolyngbyaceae cyanobacterium bins.302]